MHFADWQVAVLVLPDYGCALFGDIDVELGTACDVAYASYFEGLADVQVLAAEITIEVFVVLVELKVEIHVTNLSGEYSLESLALAIYAELAFVTYFAKLFQLLDHQFLHGKLVDDVNDLGTGGGQIRHIEHNGQQFLVLQMGDVACCGDSQFVVGSVEDLEETARVVRELHQRKTHGCVDGKTSNTMPHIFVSPVFGKLEYEKIVEWMLSEKVMVKNKARFQVQLHKVIWDPDMRGV